MAQKHLHELLQEDQEPFQLNHYIADRRCQIGRPCPKTDLQVRKRKPISRNPRFPSSFCESSCFFVGRSSPDPRKSPLFDLRSPGKSQNRVFLQVPARTAAILLEAAARIQKQSSKNAKSKVRNRGHGFGLFGSVLKRLTNRNPTRKSEKLHLQNGEGERGWFATRRNAVFSDRGSEASSSSRRESLGVFDGFGYGNADAGDFSYCDSPFHFVLQTTPSSSGDRTPHFTSPATSPTRRNTKEDEDRDETETLERLREQEQEEDKEQCSPVSVLDPPNDDEEDEEDHRDSKADLDLQCSFEVVQRAKRRLLRKLRRFEKLAGLDPMELAREMSEQEQEEEEEEGNNSEDETLTLYDSEEDLYEDLGGMEEEAVSRDKVVHQVRKKGDKDTQRKWRMLKSWKGLGFEQGVDKMVVRDFREEVGEWMRHREEVQETASDVELAIFSFLVEEFSLELVSCA